jgi:hypothetical protein
MLICPRKPGQCLSLCHRRLASCDSLFLFIIHSYPSSRHYMPRVTDSMEYEWVNNTYICTLHDMWPSLCKTFVVRSLGCSFVVLISYFSELFWRSSISRLYFSFLVSFFLLVYFYFNACQNTSSARALCKYIGCPRRNVPDFQRMFLMLKYTDITQNTCIQSWTVTEIMAREKCGLLAVPRTLPVQLMRYLYTAHVRPWL